MRTAPVALALPGRPCRLTEAAAVAVSTLTHYDPEAGEACVLWCHAIRHAVLTGAIDARASTRPAAGARSRPGGPPGWKRPSAPGPGTSPATAGWSRPCRRPGARSPPPRSPATTRQPQLVPRGPPAPGAGGGGARRPGRRHGCRYRRRTARRCLRGLGGTRALAAAAARLAGPAVPGPGRTRGPGRRSGPPAPVYGGGDRPAVTVPHPDDPGLLLADVAALRDLPAAVTAVVSLCPVADQDRQAALVPGGALAGGAAGRRRRPRGEPEPGLRPARHS